MKTYKQKGIDNVNTTCYYTITEREKSEGHYSRQKDAIKRVRVPLKNLVFERRRSYENERRTERTQSRS